VAGYWLDHRGAIIGRGNNSSLRHHCGKTGTGKGITILPVMWVLKSSILVSRKIQFRTQNMPVFQAIIIGMLTIRRNILTFPKRDETSIGFGEPSSTHELEGIGKEVTCVDE